MMTTLMCGGQLQSGTSVMRRRSTGDDRPGLPLKTPADVFAYARAEGIELRLDATGIQVRRPAVGREGRRAFVSEEA